MAFGARNEDGWRLCLRKGITIHYAGVSSASIVFKSQKAAKKCADELNEAYWKEYAKALKTQEIADDVYWGMLDVIVKHGGLTEAQVKEIENAQEYVR